MTGASAVLRPACGLRGWPAAGAAGDGSRWRGEKSAFKIPIRGKLALLHLGNVWWEQPDGLHFFSQMVEEHNQLFSFY